MSDETPDTKARHPAVEQVLRHFEYNHLPDKLQDVSEPFHYLAHAIADRFTGPETAVGLRKLLEAKDCVVRAAVQGDEV